MATEEEFFTLDDDDLEELDQLSTDKKEFIEERSSNKTIHYIVIAFLALMIILLAIFIYLYIDKKNSTSKDLEVNASKIIQNIKEKELTPKEESEVQKLLKKAESLYNQGKKSEALKIYEELSQYNKALSFYNIGVAKLKEQKYKEAIEAFEKSMTNSKLTCASALNASICALNIGDISTFQNYLRLAQKYLPYMINRPLYSYYFTLINYYKNQPIESLVSIKNPTAKFYQDEQNFIESKTLTAIENYAGAINSLNKISDVKDALTIGLLQAKIGEYSLSANTLQSALDQNLEPLKSSIALALVKNRLGLLKDSGELLKSTYDTYKEKAEETYPILVKLKGSLFDPTLAQKEFKKRLFLNDKYRYSILFYYAPYQVFNIDQTINDITKGAKKIEINSIKPALGYLTDSKAISNVNLAITKALKKIIDSKTYEANKIFKEAIRLYPAHAIVHYNLALSYAQIFDFKNAYKHFSKSYSLDNRNYLALCFKSFCAKLTGKNIPKKELEKLKRESQKREEEALIELALDSLGLDLGYLKTKNSTFTSAINLLFSYSRDDLKMYKKSALDLKNILPRDIVSNILYLDAYHDKSDIKEYAKAIQITLTQTSIDLTPLYHGGFLPKELYIRMLNIAGIESFAKKSLTRYASSTEPTISLLHSLAYSCIYNQDFKDAYKIYNSLIDKYGQKDSHTLFLAAISAIGSNHHANAVALLELAKLTDKSNFESRYALGLLYHEAKNLEGSAIEYQKIGNSGFQSDYFTFKLK
jgi:tetratricopeptide (TPR) repeat protein